MASRRGHGEGSVFRREQDGKWCAVLDLGWVDGRRRRRTRVADTRAEAVRALKRMQDEVDAGAFEVDPRTTVEQWCRRWLEADVGYRLEVGRLRPATAESYERLVRCHVIPHLGQVRLSKLDATSIQRAYRAMLDKGLSPSSVGKVHAVLRSALDAAVRDRHLVTNPCDRVDPPAVPRTEIEPLSLEHVHRILAATEGTTDHALWAVMAFCGLRLGEALGLRRTDLDLEDRTVTVAQTLGQSPRGIRFGPPKSVKGRRVVPLVDDVVTVLRDHRRLIVERRLAAARWDEDCDALFPSQVGTWQFPRNVQRRFRRLRDELDLPADTRPHTLRHTYASLLFDAGVELAVVQELLGHADLATTRSIYVHLTERIKRDAADRLEERLRNPG